MAHVYMNQQSAVTNNSLVLLRLVVYIYSSIDPAICKVKAVIKFLKAEIQRHISDVYSQAMSDAKVIKLRRLIHERETNIYDKEQSGRMDQSLIMDGLIEEIDKKICENCCFTMSQIVWCLLTFQNL